MEDKDIQPQERSAVDIIAEKYTSVQPKDVALLDALQYVDSVVGGLSQDLANHPEDAADISAYIEEWRGVAEEASAGNPEKLIAILKRDANMEASDEFLQKHGSKEAILALPEDHKEEPGPRETGLLNLAASLHAS